MTGPRQRSLSGTQSLRAAAALIGLGLFMVPPLSAKAATRAPQPTESEQTLLDQYPVFAKIIDVTKENTDNGIHEFLAANTGKTVYLDTAILIYPPPPPKMTDEIKVNLASDRFQNTVMQKCWIDPGDFFGFTDAGPQGFPLPSDAQDIESGCATRLRLVFAYGDSSPGLEIRHGSNQNELIFTGFFEVAKSELDGGQTLYTLTQEPMDEETVTAFARFQPTPERPERQLWLDEEGP